MTDQDGRHGYLWHVRKLDKKGHEPFYLALLDDDEPWSDILAPFADEGTFCVDSCGIVRVRSEGNWFGFRLSPDGGYPIRFRFCEEQLNRVAVVFVHPFRNGFAKVIVREHKEKIPGEGRRIAHVLCGTDGKIFGNFSFKYLFPERECEP